VRFALYARVSTEDRQSPEDSIAWQRSVATSLIQPTGGRLVTEYLDVGVSRSLPWPRRPEGSRLLADCARKERAFDAIVLGEPQRAFSGAQFSLTFPIFVHHGVELWVPEVGGRVDPDSEAHDLVMSLFGGLSKAERGRIQRRVRAAMHAMASTGGRYLGGRPPYGYRLVPATPHPNPEKARLGATLNRLEPDSAAAPIVQRIFAERLAGAGYTGIARALNMDSIPSPAATDPERNSHRDVHGWAASAVRAIIANARYTGHEVWGRQRRDYQLVDPNSPAEGHVRRMRWNSREQWTWSPEPIHEPLVSRTDWERVQQVSTNQPRARRTNETKYLLRGRVRCSKCGRRMTGTNQGNNRRYYRCELRRSRPGATIDHPIDVYVREKALVEALDRWLDELFAPENATETAQLIVDAGANAPAHDAQLVLLRRRHTEARQRLTQYRRALDQGADPATVTGWISEAAAEERSALAGLDALTSEAPSPMSVGHVLAVVERFGSMAAVLAEADQADRATFYEALGVTATYDPASRRAELAVEIPRSAECVSEGGLEPPHPFGH
jgi:site-specific DNA recombinase